VSLLALLFAECRCFQLHPLRGQPASSLPVLRGNSKVFYKPARTVAQQTLLKQKDHTTALLVFQPWQTPERPCLNNPGGAMLPPAHWHLDSLRAQFLTSCRAEYFCSTISIFSRFVANGQSWPRDQESQSAAGRRHLCLPAVLFARALTHSMCHVRPSSKELQVPPRECSALLITYQEKVLVPS